MSKKRAVNAVATAALAMFFALIGAGAHAQDSESQQFWPELDIVHRFDNRTKIIGLADTNRDRDRVKSA